MPHETTGVGIVIDPPGNLQKEIKLHKQHDCDWHNDHPAQQLNKGFHVLLLKKTNKKSNARTQIGENGTRFRTDTTPQKKRFCRLLYQHAQSSDERRVGKECVSTFKFWWSPYK